MKTHPSDEAFGCPEPDLRPTGASPYWRLAAWAGPRYPTQLAEPESVNV
jgi:hypothetical protein